MTIPCFFGFLMCYKKRQCQDTNKEEQVENEMNEEPQNVELPNEYNDVGQTHGVPQDDIQTSH